MTTNGESGSQVTTTQQEDDSSAVQPQALMNKADEPPVSATKEDASLHAETAANPDPDPLPEDGDVLAPGDYLVELETILPCKKENLVEGFRRMGFSEVLLDQHPLPQPKSALVREHCLIGRLARPIRIKNQSDARWLCARRLKLNVLTELRGKLVPYSLVPEKTYECRFLSRMKSQPTREMVEADLDEMGWDILKLTALRRDMRVEGREKTSVTLWFGVLVWDGAESYVTEEDPFYFDDLVEI